MKKISYAVAIISMLMGSITLTSCQSPAEKEQDAKANVQNAKEELSDTKQEVNAEYPQFKKDEEAQIAINETHIAEIRAKISDSGKAPLDGLRKKRIDDLEARNTELRSRLYSYETERTDWVTFKAGFNRDMDKLRDAFNDFGNDLKK
jgi:predicted  nucleic acid-binding Zn-ribbon protein